MMIVVTLVLPLALLIWLVYRGWPILLVAPIMAVCAAGLSAEPLMASLTQRFMPATGNFIIAFTPLFVLGAVFGKLMEASGCATALARFIVSRLGAGQAIPAVVLSCALLTYGGVSLFVVAFAVYPLAIALFRQANLPPRLIPAAIALGAFTFTMSALPGSPAIQNAIPMPYFGTTAFAAPGLGVIAGMIMAAGGLLYLAVAARATGASTHAPTPVSETSQTVSLPPLWIAILPIVTVFVVNWAVSRIFLPRLDLSYLNTATWGGIAPAQVIGMWSLIGALALAAALLLILTWQRLDSPRDALAQGSQSALLPLFNTAGLVGFGAVVAGLPAFAMLSTWIQDMPGGVLASLAVSASLLAGLTGSASGGMSIALDTLGAQYLDRAVVEGVDPGALHRIVALATGGLDALPHNGAVVTLLGIGKLSHREAYLPIFVVAVAIPVVALLVTLGIATYLGTF